MRVNEGNFISGDQFASSGANNATVSNYARQTRELDNSTGREPDPRNSVCKEDSIQNLRGCDVGFAQPSAVNPILHNIGVHGPVYNFANGPHCQSAAEDACNEATAPRNRCSPVVSLDGGSSTLCTINGNQDYTATPTFSSAPAMTVVQARKRSNEMSIYRGNCDNSAAHTVFHAGGLGSTAACKPQITPARLQNNNLYFPAWGIVPYLPHNQNPYFLNNIANNQLAWTYFCNFTNGNLNFISPVVRNAQAWWEHSSMVRYPGYTGAKILCRENANSASAASGSNDAGNSNNLCPTTVNNEPSNTDTYGGNENYTQNMSGYAVTGGTDEPTMASGSFNGAVFGMPQKCMFEGQLDKIQTGAESARSIVYSDVSAAATGTAASDVTSTCQIGPQAYPCAYSAILNSSLSRAADATSTPKRKLKWPLPIPLFIRPHETKLTFHDIDYTWVTHDIQVSAQGGVYAQTIDSKGCLQVFVESARTANNLLQLDHVAGIPAIISVGRNYTDNIGYIRKVPRRYSNTVLFEFLEDEGLLCAKRQIGYQKFEKGYSGDVTTGTVVLLFLPDRPLPSSVTIDNISYQVTRRLPQPVQCFNCQRYGHEAMSCTDSTRCRCCGGPHVLTDCTSRGKPECANCHEPHASTFWRCPARLAHASSDPRNDWVRDAIKDV